LDIHNKHLNSHTHWKAPPFPSLVLGRHEEWPHVVKVILMIVQPLISLWESYIIFLCMCGLFDGVESCERTLCSSKNHRISLHTQQFNVQFKGGKRNSTEELPYRLHKTSYVYIRVINSLFTLPVLLDTYVYTLLCIIHFSIEFLSLKGTPAKRVELEWKYMRNKYSREMQIKIKADVPRRRRHSLCV